MQQDQVSRRISKGALCQDHFFAILSVFSGIFLVNYVLLNLAASAFYSTGLVLLTFHEALSLLDQVKFDNQAYLFSFRYNFFFF